MTTGDVNLKDPALNDSKETVSALNAVLRHTLSAISQYFLHARMLKHSGVLDYADYSYRTSLGFMKASDMLVELLLSLGGVPDMQDMAPVMIGKTPQEMLGCDLAHAESTLQHVMAAQAACAQNKRATDILSHMSGTLGENINYLRSMQAEERFSSTSSLSTTNKDCA